MTLAARLEPAKQYQKNRPRVGDEITYNSPAYGLFFGTITEVSGAICYYRVIGESNPTCFIWCFREGLNKLHSWPTKNARD